MTREKLPIAALQKAILEFLRGRDDAVVFGAQAVNAYVDELRMTDDVDVFSTAAESLAKELCGQLRDRFKIAARVRRLGEGGAFRVYQARKSGGRHLADVRSVKKLPRSNRIAGVLVMAPAELIASKAIGRHRRRGQPKSGTDWRDLAMLLLAFPELKRDPGPVTECLRAAGAAPEALAEWRELVAQEIRRPAEDEGY
jgi:hypothetical protein